LTTQPFCTRKDLLASVARGLLREHAAGKPFHPLAADSGVDGLAAAYAVQRNLVELFNPEGIAPAGYKIGLTSARMQKMCGVDSPLAGVVLANRVYASGVELMRGNYGRLGLEFEIGVVLQRDLPASCAPFDTEAIARATGGICAAVEVVDDRCADYRTLDACSIIADNAWNAGAVLGRFTSPWLDLAEIEGIVRLNGSDVDRGMGRDVLGHPFVPLTWLANHLAASGEGLKTGQIVLTGSLVPTRLPAAGQYYEFELKGIGSVSVTVPV
jgi:2-keto-4-pentenoate hydratase